MDMSACQGSFSYHHTLGLFTWSFLILFFSSFFIIPIPPEGQGKNSGRV